MKYYEAGVTEITYPFFPRWTGDVVEAETEQSAEDSFGKKGYYRNLVVRQVYLVCPHTLEKNWPLDSDDFYVHTHCKSEGDCLKVTTPLRDRA